MFLLKVKRDELSVLLRDFLVNAYHFRENTRN